MSERNKPDTNTTDRDSVETDDTKVASSERTTQSGAERLTTSDAQGQDVHVDELLKLLSGKVGANNATLEQIVLSQGILAHAQALSHNADVNAQKIRHADLSFTAQLQSMNNAQSVANNVNSNLTANCQMTMNQRSTVDGKTAENITGINETDLAAARASLLAGISNDVLVAEVSRRNASK